MARGRKSINQTAERNRKKIAASHYYGMLEKEGKRNGVNAQAAHRPYGRLYEQEERTE